MKKKNILIIFIFVIVLLLVVLGYKVLLLNKYKAQEVIINTNNIFDEVLTISTEVEVTDNETLKIEKLSIKNNFKEYVDSETNSNLKVKYDSEGKVTSFYSISKANQYINMLNSNSFNLYTDNEDKNYNYETEESMKIYLEKNKIENDIDLLKYIKDKYYIKNNILMSKEIIKNNFLINCLVEVTLPEFEKIVLIDGMITGYIINMKNSNTKEIHLLYNEEQYILSLSGEEITNREFIINLLQTVKFNG